MSESNLSVLSAQQGSSIDHQPNSGTVFGSGAMSSHQPLVDPLSEVSSLEGLILRQKEELEELEEEMTCYKEAWEQRLRDLRGRHREQRRKLLGLVDHRDSGHNREAKRAQHNSGHSNYDTGGASPLNVYHV